MVPPVTKSDQSCGDSSGGRATRPRVQDGTLYVVTDGLADSIGLAFSETIAPLDLSGERYEFPRVEIETVLVRAGRGNDRCWWMRRSMYRSCCGAGRATTRWWAARATTRCGGGSGADSLDGAAGGADVLRGDRDADTPTGGSGADTLRGGPGDDWLAGIESDDLFQGGSGIDCMNDRVESRADKRLAWQDLVDALMSLPQPQSGG
jgi:hypothetical protein